MPKSAETEPRRHHTRIPPPFRARIPTRPHPRTTTNALPLPFPNYHPIPIAMASALALTISIPVSSLPLSASASTSLARRLRALPPTRGLRSPALRALSGLAGNRRGGGRGMSVVCAVQGQDTTIQVPDVTKSTWQSLVMESELPVLVDFWASWCGPCKMIDPVVAKLSKEYEGKLKCYKLNTDENPDIASQYGVRSIPTIMIFKNGEKKDSVIGAVPESTLITCIEKFVER